MEIFMYAIGVLAARRALRRSLLLRASAIRRRHYFQRGTSLLKVVVNRKHKDVLFRIIFRDKGKLLELYNAVNGTNYKNVEELEIITLEDAIYMNVKNDIAFLIGSQINLYEHQSTWNPNMPVRCLIYIAKNMINWWIKNHYIPENFRSFQLPDLWYFIMVNRNSRRDRLCACPEPLRYRCRIRNWN